MNFNYKKSLLSIAAVTALTMTSLNAGYIPLTDTADNEETWVLFGVTGLKTTGAGAGTSAGTFSVADSVANVAEDTTQDDLYVEGMTVDSKSLGKVKILAPYSTVEVRVDTTGATYNETEPVRTMYVTMTEGGGPAFAFTYRASLEGRTLQYSTAADGSDAHTVTINSANTYNNPAFGAVIQEIAGLPGSSLSKLSDMVDYDFSDNPPNSSYYSKTTNQDTAVAANDEYLRVYSFDATTQTWKLYDSRNTDESNDFSELEKGKAYWAKMDNPANKVGGLVLGSSSVSATDYTDAGITEGWNLLAFDNENPDIRKSNTGLVITLAGNATINIYDASGNHVVKPTVNNGDEELSCRNINQSIKAAKIQGSFPKDFDLRAYPTGIAAEIALISNKRFFVREEPAGGIIDDVVTLTGAHPYTITSSAAGTLNLNTADDTNQITDLVDAGTSAVMSKYGEYAMVIEPLVVAGTTAGDQDIGKIHIQSAASDATTVAAISIDNANAGASTVEDTFDAITANNDIGGYTAVADQLDIDLDGTTESVIIASTKPFYVRDHTFTRVFKFTAAEDAADVDNVLTISGVTTSGTVTLAKGSETDADTAATKIDGAGLSVQSDDDGAGNIIVITDDVDANEFVVNEDLLEDRIQDSTSSSDPAKGAVKGIYSLSNLSTATLTNTVISTAAGDGLALQDHENDSLQVSITTLNGTFDDLDTAVGADAIADQAAFSAYTKTQIETLLDTKNIQYSSVTVSNADPAEVTIISSEVTDFTITATDGGGANTADTAAVDSSLLGVTSPSADLSDDLKFNAVYSPNYVTDGPLYTMKSATYTLKALVTGSTDLTDGSVNWDSVDLTRSPSDWLDSQDYNLFQINQSAGYWAYLEAGAAASTLNVANAVIKPLTYTYRFNAKNAAGTEAINYNSVSGNIALTIDGLDADSRAVPVVSATVAGSVVELANVAGSNIYTGKLSSYEIENMSKGYEYEVLANVADGLGYHLISQDVQLKVDFLKPATPTIDLTTPTAVAFSSTSTDVTGYYVYNGQIPEVNTANATNLLTKLSSTDAAAYGLCGAVDALDWDAAAYSLNVIAIDGLGKLGQGNVSNTAIKPYVPMLQNSVLVTNTNQGDGNIVATILGETHDATCASTGAQTINYGVTLASISDFQTAKLAYTPKNLANGFGTIITLYVTGTVNAGSAIAEINYAEAYAGEKVYVEIGGAVYSLILPTADEIEGAEYTGADEGTTDTNPLDLDDATAAPNNVKATYYTGQSL